MPHLYDKSSVQRFPYDLANEINIVRLPKFPIYCAIDYSHYGIFNSIRCTS